MELEITADSVDCSEKSGSVVIRQTLSSHLPVEKGFRFGPYPGEDAEDAENSSWMTFIAKARTITEANLVIVWDEGKIYYEASEDIPANKSLLLWTEIYKDSSTIENSVFNKDISLRFTSVSASQNELLNQKSCCIYTCDVCQRSFKKKRSLVSHRSIHTNEKPFKCTECNSTFRWESPYYAHRLLHSGKHKCPVCARVFLSKGALSIHVMKHDNQLPFLCDFCGKGFTNRNYWRQHLNVHMAIYKCEKCSKCFGSDKLLTKHCEWHSNGSTFVCSHCGRMFMHKKSLHLHCQKCHAVIEDSKIPGVEKDPAEVKDSVEVSA